MAESDFLRPTLYPSHPPSLRHYHLLQIHFVPSPPLHSYWRKDSPPLVRQAPLSSPLAFEAELTFFSP
ncbi:hypothetical protein L211DRAFT_837885 [Terfezia boudieri ATCC MYA-4762]|uniref:Uncharacterized protein n=1 Tax=Terfezia boudieri ATCC MYA-4762 TaxID=1051890 RepID=A0A3N4LMF5_9PEZI|nr:hypothetical protein L211DRAFT_837885 [Terfezia boudieri ATCC MYA-4762]